MTLLLEQSASNYSAIGIQLIFVLIFVVVTIAASHILGPKRKNASKFANFECGIPQQGDARQPMAIKYFLIAILFVIFDVELVFFFPYAVNFKLLGKPAFSSVLVFVGMFLVGYTYVIKRGVMEWKD